MFHACMSASEQAAYGKTHVALSAHVQNTGMDLARAYTWGKLVNMCLLGQYARLRIGIGRIVLPSTHCLLASPRKAVTSKYQDAESMV